MTTIGSWHYLKHSGHDYLIWSISNMASSLSNMHMKSKLWAYKSQLDQNHLAQYTLPSKSLITWRLIHNAITIDNNLRKRGLILKYFDIKSQPPPTPSIKQINWKAPLLIGLNENTHSTSRGNPNLDICGGIVRDYSRTFLGAFQLT